MKKPLPLSDKKRSNSSLSIKGRVEKYHENTIIGWAQYEGNDQPVNIDVFEGKTFLATIKADQGIEIDGTTHKNGFSYPLAEKYLSGKPYSFRFVEKESQKALGSLFRLGDGKFDTHFTLLNNQVLTGTVQQRTSSQALYTVTVSLDGEPFGQQQFQGGSLEKIGVKLPPIPTDNKSHNIQIKLANEQEKVVFTTIRKIKRDQPQTKTAKVSKPVIKIKGRVETFYNSTITGWAQYEGSDQPVHIDVYENKTFLETITANQNIESSHASENNGFCYLLPKKYLSGTSYKFRFIEKENQKLISGSPFRLGDGKFDTHFTVENNQALTGSVQQRTISQAPYTMIVALDGQVFWQKQFQGGSLEKINLKLPSIPTDDKDHNIQIKLINEQEKVVFTTLRKIKQAAIKTAKANKPTIKGRVEKFYNMAVVGWVQYGDDKSKVASIDVYDGDKYLETIKADQNTKTNGAKSNIGFSGFTYPLPKKYLSGDLYALKFIEKQSQRAISGSPFRLGNGRFDTDFQIKKGQYLVGTIQQRTSSKAVYTLVLSLDGEIFSQQKFQGGKTENIQVNLPASVFDSKKHNVQIKLLNNQEKSAFISSKKVIHRYRGVVESVTFEQITGWIVNEEYPSTPVEIDIAINGKKINTLCDIKRHDVQNELKLASSQLGFTIKIPSAARIEPSVNIDIFIKNTNNRILTKQYILTPKDILIRSLISAAEHLNSQLPQQQNIDLSAGLKVENNANTLVRQQIIWPIIQQLRQQPGLPASLNLSVNSACQIPAITKSPVIDVIIPVYKGYDETIACIESVLSANNTVSYQLFVINDQSPDGRLSFKLQAMAKDKLFILLENEKNLGFVGTANRGLHLHKDRDVVLLNSDTEVYDEWLDRMLAALQKNNNIATVTPFSNNATICSFPQFNQDNELGSNYSPQQLNHWFAELNDKQSVDLPTAVGFCMLIKREVIETIGYLDEQTWQKGYGEENDFCLKASALGWRNVLAADVFVTHHGSVSFAGDKQAYLSANLAKLNTLYPDYPTTVERFVRQDPIAPLRRPVIKKMLQQQSDKYLLFIMHSLGGGAKTNADDMANLLEQQGHAVLELSPQSETQWLLKDSSGHLCLSYQYPQDYQKLEHDLRELGVWRVHFHQLIGFPKQIWQLPKALACAYDFTAHDFLPICPRINMIDESGHYCEESQYDTKKCQRCISLNDLPELGGYENLWQEHGQSVKQWRKRFKKKLQKAENVFCPSQSTAKIYKNHYALKNLNVKEHPETSFVIQKPTDYTSDTINIAIIGAIGEHKGSELLLRCAQNALKEGLPLRFILIGFSNIDESLNQLDNVTITGEYKGSEQLQHLITQHECQLALFLSLWPETFCYTLTEALKNNLYPVALNYGAIADRIKVLKYGSVIHAHLSPEEINKKLVKAAKKAANIKADTHYQGAQYSNILKEYYQLEKK